ncbi:hypothetical protein WJX72_005872 [[Myrmecia] bisecta]|uniref:Smr domain-containing protein n=1 Tax=[Myrmecia] bisecta TaxID=41462 RepID=A0AAW1QAT6_9CHLO
MLAGEASSCRALLHGLAEDAEVAASAFLAITWRPVAHRTNSECGHTGMIEEPPTPTQLRIKAGTAVLTVGITLGLLLYDWDNAAKEDAQVMTKLSALLLNANACEFVPVAAKAPSSDGSQPSAPRTPVAEQASAALLSPQADWGDVGFAKGSSSVQHSADYSEDASYASSWDAGYRQDWPNGWPAAEYLPYTDQTCGVDSTGQFWYGAAAAQQLGASGMYDATSYDLNGYGAGAYDTSGAYVDGAYAANGYASAENGYAPPEGYAADGQYWPPANQPPAPPPQRATKATRKAEANATVAVLAQQFPAYSLDSLRELLDVNKRDLASALDMLAQLEAEQDGQLPAGQEQAPPALDEDNFPSLAAASPARQPSAKHTAAKGSSTSAPQSPIASLDSTSSGDSARTDANAEATAPTTPPRVHAAAMMAASPLAVKSGFADAVRKPAQSTKSPASPTDVFGGVAAEKPRAAIGQPTIWPAQKASADVAWVDTGASVARQYSDAREEARAHALARNAYFQNATQAYLAGNKAAAKELGARGRWHSEQMKAAHAAASENIFQQRNGRSWSGAGKAGSANGLIDLHGLHVSEAMRILRRELSQLQGKPANGARAPAKLHICVGTGHHTKGARTPARLPTAVESFLTSEGFQFRHSQPGLLEVTLQG